MSSPVCSIFGRLVSVATVALGLAAVYPSSALGDAVDDIHAQLEELGTQDGVQLRLAVQELYMDLHEQSDRSDVEIERDVRYGIYEHQMLDLYLPTDRGDQLLPIVIFVHGGNLDTGDKLAGGAKEFLYGNVATFFARNGFIGVNANYRLVPDIVWPQGAEDLREIVGWLVYENAESYGGDPDAMFMMGTSGGARHVASFMFYRPAQMVRGTGLLGAILSSPMLGASDSEAFAHYYGEDAATQERFSPTGLVESFDGDRLPVLLLSGEFDPPHIEISTAEMYASLCLKYGDCPRFEQLRYHNRFSAVTSLNTADETVSVKVLEFVRDLYDARDTR